MPFLPVGGSGSGSGGAGGLTLGPVPNSFTAATRAAAEALRDAAATGITGTLLAEYDANPTFTITLNWPAVPTNTVYQARRSSAWADVTGLVRGPRGIGGVDGTDGTAGTDGTDGTDGVDGSAGTDGASGGGALQLLGTVGPRTVTAAQDDLWIDLGFDWPDDSDFIVYRRVGGALLIWLDGAEIYGDDAVVVGTIGAASVTAQRYTINDAGLSGTTYLGRNAAGRALIEFNNTIATAFTLQLYKYVQGNENGLQGPSGLPGASGVDGADGTDGTDGVDGAAGAAGADGAPGADGSGAETLFGVVDPVASDGNDNDTWINTADGTIWKKASGAWTKEYTFPSGGTMPVGDHTRRVAISADTALAEDEVTAGTSSMTSTVTTPDWGNGVLRHIFIGVPEDEDDILDILYNGLSQFSGYEVYDTVGGDPIIVSTHKWWYTTAAQDGEYFSGIDLEIEQ